MIKKTIIKILIFSLVIFLTGCRDKQIPPELQMVEKQEINLWRSGAQIYAPVEYSSYKISFGNVKELLIKEKSRFAWFQDYQKVQSELRNILIEGNLLQNIISDNKKNMNDKVFNEISLAKNRIDTIKGLTEMINEGRLARKNLIKAELLLSEAIIRYNNNDYNTAEKKLNNLSGFIKASENAILPILNRYSDRNHIKKWQKMVEETIAQSKKMGIPAIIVNKSERTLVLYKSGVPAWTYIVGIGRNGSLDKQRAGDNSTPEGKYRIIKKKSESRYHKALLLNYPNEEDRKNFILAKKNGLIPAKSGIGGLIEIHGGGKNSMTYGCIAMDNSKIDHVFNIVSVGTPVTIVGAVDYNNKLSSAIEGL
ncbi:MAG: L,D-transpeptidase [Proteobacteria bacterium]|nr:L,D-transpeptidase [Pseudomonadota bacterium]MBU4010650.1 L,D-transpeptidase [Pseudomonadota bacterium]MBU4035843.1 L,D-transpeptidase [Pseudomonadota bacterium]